MISFLQGSLTIASDSEVIIWANGIGYQIMVPATVMHTLQKKSEDECRDVRLITFHYLENNQSRIVPRLIGFNNEIEREFFELFITVADLGPKTAVRALSKAFHSIAESIEQGNHKELTALPGIGDKKARQIVATLQGKAGKFAMLQDEEISSSPQPKEDIQTDAIEVLLQLGYRRSEAQAMVTSAVESTSPRPKTSEELIQKIYELKLMK